MLVAHILCDVFGNRYINCGVHKQIIMFDIDLKATS